MNIQTRPTRRRRILFKFLKTTDLTKMKEKGSDRTIAGEIKVAATLEQVNESMCVRFFCEALKHFEKTQMPALV